MPTVSGSLRGGGDTLDPPQSLATAEECPSTGTCLELDSQYSL